MNTKRWISLGVTLAAIVLAIAMIKVFPIYVTFCCLITFVCGTVAGYLFKNPEVQKVIEYVEKIVEVPNKVTKPKKNKKVE